MPSRIADAESRLVSKCRKCGSYFWMANSVPPAECEPYLEPCLALTQAELDALLDAERRKQAARIAALEKALEPFAEVGRLVNPRMRDDHRCWGAEDKQGEIVDIQIVHLREAARVKGEK